jgi:hypothetical protein
MTSRGSLPTWASRVTQKEIRRLYETDARGIYDEDLINEVGYGLLARCQSFIEANQACEGKVRCPQCSAIVRHERGKEDILRCACGWELSWREYFKTIQHRQLSGAEPVLEQFRKFVNTFPSVRSPQEKMLAIDCLIHGFHWFFKTNKPTRPVAVNLIEGRLSEVVAFLERLTYSDSSTPGIRQNYAQWDENINVNQDWYSSRKKADRSKDPPGGK